MKPTVPQDQQVSPLWSEVDNTFCPLSDAVDAASNVLETFGELRGDPNAQAAVIGPRLRESYKEVFERVLALCGYERQLATESPGDLSPTKKQPDNLSQIDYALCDLGTVCDAVSEVMLAHVEDGRMTSALAALGTQLPQTWRETYDKVLELARVTVGDDAPVRPLPRGPR